GSSSRPRMLCSFLLHVVLGPARPGRTPRPLEELTDARRPGQHRLDQPRQFAAHTAKGVPPTESTPHHRSACETYLPVLKYWMQSPWFLKVELSVLVTTSQPL